VGNAPEYPRVFIRLICFVALGVIERGVARSSRRVSALAHTFVRAVLSEPNFVWKPFKTSWPSGYFTKEEGPRIYLPVGASTPYTCVCAVHTPQRDRGDPNEFFAEMLPCDVYPPNKILFPFSCSRSMSLATPRQPEDSLDRRIKSRHFVSVRYSSTLACSVFVDVLSMGKLSMCRGLKSRACDRFELPRTFVV